LRVQIGRCGLAIVASLHAVFKGQLAVCTCERAAGARLLCNPSAVLPRITISTLLDPSNIVGLAKVGEPRDAMACGATGGVTIRLREEAHAITTGARNGPLLATLCLGALWGWRVAVGMLRFSCATHFILASLSTFACTQALAAGWQHATTLTGSEGVAELEQAQIAVV